MHIAVTGGRGALGRSLTARALATGHTVAAIDNRLPGPGEHLDPGLSHLSVDATTYDDLVEAMAGCDAVVHLASFTSPEGRPDHEVHNMNVVASYNALCAAVELGITRVCLASSINAIGGAYSREPRYDYFPLDERHPTYTEDPYGLSKWMCEIQADSVARRNPAMTIGSLRLHHLVTTQPPPALDERAHRRDLWGYTTFAAASRACLAVLEGTWKGHEVFYVVAPTTVAATPSIELCRALYPGVPVTAELAGRQGFFDCSKAARLLGWVHDPAPGA